MNTVCSEHLQSLSTIAYQALEVGATSEHFVELHQKFINIKKELDIELNRLHKNIGTRRYRNTKKEEENLAQLSNDSYTDVEKRELKKKKKNILKISKDIEEDQKKLTVYREQCLAVIGTWEAVFLYYSSVKNGQVSLEVNLPSGSNIFHTPRTVSQKQLIAFSQVDVYQDENAAKQYLVHVKTGQGHFLCFLYDKLTTGGTCETGRIVFLHQKALRDLNTIVGEKNYNFLNDEELLYVKDFYRDVDLVRSKIRRMFANNKIGKADSIQLPSPQNIQNINAKFNELVWDLASDSGFKLLNLNIDDDLDREEAYRLGAFNTPDDSGKIVCVGVMGYIFRPLLNHCNELLAMTKIREANTLLNMAKESNCENEVNVVQKSDDSIVFQMMGEKQQETNVESNEAKTKEAKALIKNGGQLLVLAALGRLENVQEKLLQLTAKLKNGIAKSVGA